MRGLHGVWFFYLFSNFRFHIKESKWGRKSIFINCTSCNGRPQQIPFLFANGKLPHSCCRAFWAVSSRVFKLTFIPAYRVTNLHGMFLIPWTWIRWVSPSPDDADLEKILPTWNCLSMFNTYSDRVPTTFPLPSRNTQCIYSFKQKKST